MKFSLKVFVVITLIMATSCATSYAGKNDQENTLVFANYRDLRDLNPHLYGGELFAMNLLFESLVHLDQGGNPEPWLAKSWTVSEDGTTYTFKLRDDVAFSDGTKFDANVVKQNFDALLDNGKRHGWLESIRLMMEVEAAGGEAVHVVDDYTVEVHFTKAYYPFLVELGVTRPFRFLSPKCFKEGTTKNGTSCYVGTGSYVLDHNQIDEYSEFSRNPNYWGEAPAIEKVITKVIPDNQSRLMALENGEIDLIFGLQMISPRAFQRFEGSSDFGTALSDPVSTRMLVLNTTSEFLSERKVRQALQHLTDKQIIAEKIMLGLETPADTLFSKSIPYANIDLPVYDADKAKAEGLFAEAGWKRGETYLEKDGKIFEITLSYDSDKVIEKTIAQYLQSEWSKSGVKLNLVGEEEQAHRDRLKGGEFDISFNISWGTPYDPQSFLGSMRKPVYGDMIAQQGLKEKAKIDESILLALETVDETARQELYTYILETLHKEAVYIPLTYERNRAVFNKKLQNVSFNPSQFEIPIDRMKLQ